MELSVVIPARNEADRIGRSLEAVLAFLDGMGVSSELVVVDDGSTDETSIVAARYDRVRLVRHQTNKGKGAAVRTGMLAATGDYRFFMDADLSTPVEALVPALEKLKNGASVVIGSRSLDRGRIVLRQPPHREYMGRIYNLVVRLLGLTDIADTQCGFKGFTADAAKMLFTAIKTEGFSFDVEVLAVAKLRNMRVEELPVAWRDSARSGVRIMTDPAKMFFELLKIAANLRKAG